MKLKKAIKTLEQKGTGVVFRISEMEKNYNPEKYFNEVQTYGYLLKYIKDSHGFMVKSFKLVGIGEPYQYIDFYDGGINLGEDITNDEWGYYTFGELYKKFGELALHFGLDDVVYKSTEKVLDLYS